MSITRDICYKYIDNNGVEEIIEITLTTEEKAALEKSADAVRELKEALKRPA